MCDNIVSDKVCKEMILMWSNSVFHTRAHYVRVYVFTWPEMDLYVNLDWAFFVAAMCEKRSGKMH